MIQVLMAVLGSLGFALLFQTKGKKLYLIASGGAISWIVYLFFYVRNNDPVISTLLSTIVVAAIAELAARMIKTPVIILLVPMLIPLIPGGNLYYAMHNLLLGQSEESTHYLQLALEEAGAIAGGIILLAFITQIITKTKNYVSNVKKSNENS